GTDLWHFKARTYDPKLGRFLQPDPIGYGDGLNMYAYAGGDPVNATDPTGLGACGPDAADVCKDNGTGGTLGDDLPRDPSLDSVLILNVDRPPTAGERFAENMRRQIINDLNEGARSGGGAGRSEGAGEAGSGGDGDSDSDDGLECNEFLQVTGQLAAAAGWALQTGGFATVGVAATVQRIGGPAFSPAAGQLASWGVSMSIGGGVLAVGGVALQEVSDGQAGADLGRIGAASFSAFGGGGFKAASGAVGAGRAANYLSATGTAVDIKGLFELAGVTGCQK
ncbi:MAG: RHS repeat-associated core domain-containing protein, partial [Pseudomonadota bacterium]